MTISLRNFGISRSKYQFYLPQIGLINQSICAHREFHILSSTNHTMFSSHHSASVFFSKKPLFTRKGVYSVNIKSIALKVHANDRYDVKKLFYRHTMKLSHINKI